MLKITNKGCYADLPRGGGLKFKPSRHHSQSVVEGLPSVQQGSPLGETLTLKGQRSGQSLSSRQLCLKIILGILNLWGLHKAWVELSNKAVYSRSVYLHVATETWWTACYSDMWRREKTDRGLTETFLPALQTQACRFTAGPKGAHTERFLPQRQWKANYRLNNNNKVALCKSCQGFLKSALIMPLDPGVK